MLYLYARFDDNIILVGRPSNQITTDIRKLPIAVVSQIITISLSLGV